MAIDITLYDRKGVKQTFESKDKIVVDTPDESVRAIFTYGEALSDAKYELDMTDGDQTITLNDGELLKSFTIKKPKTLVPENIPIGINIAGVDGTLYASNFDPRDILVKYFVFTIDIDNETIILYKILYDKIYADTGDYNVIIPDKLGNYSVIINNTGIENENVNGGDE